MRNNQSVAKTGVIDKNTKIIFRSNCCKLTVGIELSVQTFKLNQNKELYLEKMIEFLYVFLQRNNYFNNTHRLTLMFYGRCFYPKFKTLKEAYDYLVICLISRSKKTLRFRSNKNTRLISQLRFKRITREGFTKTSIEESSGHRT